MDHAIATLSLFWEVEVDQLREEWQRGQYKKTERMSFIQFRKSFDRCYKHIKEIFRLGNIEIKGFNEGLIGREGKW